MRFFCFLVLFFSLSTLSAREEQSVSTLIIGGGIGGGTAALYLARAGLHPLVVTGATPGGALSQSDSVENWPGIARVRGAELVARIREQAEDNGARFLDAEVVNVDFKKRPFRVTTRSFIGSNDKQTYRADQCIIATGSSPNHLEVPGEQDYWGRGVTCCAICDGTLYKGKKVGVVGGGDAALLETLYLANLAEEVSLFVRKDRLKGSDEKRKESVLALPNVKVFYETTVEEVLGDDEGVTGVKIKQGQERKERVLSALFLAIGSKPNTALFKGQLELDANGYIVLKRGQETSISGVYAVGDAADPIDRQAISAAGAGARAALAIQRDGRAFQQSVVEVRSRSQFEQELNVRGVSVLVDFYADWCGPCKRIAPRLDALAPTLKGTVKILKVNVDQNRELANSYHIRSLPTVLLFKDGAIVDQKSGETPILDLLTHLCPSL